MRQLPDRHALFNRKFCERMRADDWHHAGFLQARLPWILVRLNLEACDRDLSPFYDIIDIIDFHDKFAERLQLRPFVYSVAGPIRKLYRSIFRFLIEMLPGRKERLTFSTLQLSLPPAIDQVRKYDRITRFAEQLFESNPRSLGMHDVELFEQLSCDESADDDKEESDRLYEVLMTLKSVKILDRLPESSLTSADGKRPIL